MSVARYVNLSFVAIGLILYIVLGEFFGWAIRLFGSSANAQILGANFRVAHLLALLVATGAAIWLRRDRRVYTYATEVGQELSKSTWPTWDETKKATLVVLVITTIIAGVLGLMDFVWKGLAGWYYGS